MLESQAADRLQRFAADIKALSDCVDAVRKIDSIDQAVGESTRRLEQSREAELNAQRLRDAVNDRHVKQMQEYGQQLTAVTQQRDEMVRQVTVAEQARDAALAAKSAAEKELAAAKAQLVSLHQSALAAVG